MQDEIITVNKGNYFPVPVVVLGSISIFGALAVFLVWIHHAIVFEVPFMRWGDILLNFFMKDFLLMVLLVAVGVFFVFSRKTYDFNPEKKQVRNAGHFYHWDWGEWKEFYLDGSYLAFQRYEQTNNYSYGGIYERKVSEYVYDLRLVKQDGTFESIVSGSDFRCVSEIIVLGKKMGEVYGLNFNDYVREIVRKELQSRKTRIE